MSYYPQNLKHYVNRLAGYSSTTVKLSPLAGKVNATPRSTISVSLPPSSIVLPQTFTMWFKGLTSGTTTSGTGTPTVLFPQNIESVISSLQVTANSLPLDNGPGMAYNQLWNIISDLTLVGKKSERSLYQGARDIPCQAVNTASPLTPVNAATSTTAGAIAPNPVVPYVPWGNNGAGVYDATRPQQFAISNWLGMLNSEECLDTDICGDVRVNLTLADSNVCVINELTTNPASVSYTLQGVYFSITTISLAPEWYQAQAMFLEKMNTIERKMNLWWCFQGPVIPGTNAGQLGQSTGTANVRGSATTTVNFSLSSQSVDLMLGAFLTVPDTSRLWLCRYDADSNFFQVGTSAFKGLAFKRPGNMIQDYQFSCNAVNIRPYRVAASEAF